MLALPLGIAAASLGLLLANLRGVVSVLYLNADTASAPVIASLADAAPRGRVVTLGNYPSYETIWLLRATLGLPEHRALWEAAPVVWTAVALLALVVAAWALFGRLVALLTAAILICLTPSQQAVFFTLDTHGPLLVHACVLVGVLLWLSGRHEPPGWPLLGALALGLAAFTAAAVASDRLSIVACLVPFLSAACVGAVRFGGPAERRVACFAVATTALSLAGGWLAGEAMRESHWLAASFPVELVAVREAALQPQDVRRGLLVPRRRHALRRLPLGHPHGPARSRSADPPRARARARLAVGLRAAPRSCGRRSVRRGRLRRTSTSPSGAARSSPSAPRSSSARHRPTSTPPATWQTPTSPSRRSCRSSSSAPAVSRGPRCSPE